MSTKCGLLKELELAVGIMRFGGTQGTSQRITKKLSINEMIEYV